MSAQKKTTHVGSGVDEDMAREARWHSPPSNRQDLDPTSSRAGNQLLEDKATTCHWRVNRQNRRGATSSNERGTTATSCAYSRRGGQGLFHGHEEPRVPLAASPRRPPLVPMADGRGSR
ncbi:hypothetical protein H6P81_014191 [Aristolochia fimbriata]|uniref:Uncharacterized protein n=1 Tax=Aristolochia fimbriata TaxID=158543 RepID=A0AAV7EH20_ARIFI|nr:hypothetical protein H6P81_014191 [Aristolochia fimbriata]